MAYSFPSYGDCLGMESSVDDQKPPGPGHDSLWAELERDPSWRRREPTGKSRLMPPYSPRPATDSNPNTLPTKPHHVYTPAHRSELVAPPSSKPYAASLADASTMAYSFPFYGDCLGMESSVDDQKPAGPGHDSLRAELERDPSWRRREPTGKSRLMPPYSPRPATDSNPNTLPTKPHHVYTPSHRSELVAPPSSKPYAASPAAASAMAYSFPFYGDCIGMESSVDDQKPPGPGHDSLPAELERDPSWRRRKPTGKWRWMREDERPRLSHMPPVLRRHCTGDGRLILTKITSLPTQNPAQVPETMSPQFKEPCQMDDSPSSTSVLSGYDYDVFLSFRGPDTRTSFVDFLCTSLLDAGICTYRDDEELRVGDEIGPGLHKAIGNSKISIPIFSKGYASSKWCLNELVRMMECRKTGRQKIMPIFYYVTPSEVRHQTGLFTEAFALHEKQCDNKVISKWKAALEEAGKIKGWHVDQATNRREGELVKLIVHEVEDELKKANLLVTDCLVGDENHVKEINRMMCGNPSDIWILGIYGLGGVGKTTLAKIIYNQLSHRFEDRCFLSAIKETSELNGIEWLQDQLISSILKGNQTTIRNVDEGMKTIKERLSGKKVLVLLDDVDKRTHLKSLMGKPAWFGLGSMIIITSRNKDIVAVPEVTCTYELVSMDFNQSLRLFCKHAFGSDYPPDDYDAFSKEVVKTTGGLPLALEAIGSQLSSKRKDDRDVILKKLRKAPHEEVKRSLKISYDALDDLQKHIFLDIACLFVGFDIRIVLHMWNEDKCILHEDLRVLQQLSLIKIGEDNKLWMHNQLRDLGRDIVRQECNMELKKRSRLWDHEEALDIVMKKKGSKKIEALSLKFDKQLQCYRAIQELEKLSNLKYLEVRIVPKNWPSNDLAADIQKRLPMLSELRWLSWHQLPLELELTNLSMMNIVILDLSWSKFSESWDGWTYIKMARNLKVLNLTGCAHLHRSPDFSGNVNLEHLILENCAGLIQIDISIGHLKQLVFLNLRFCINLCKLPEEICNLESLKELLIDGTFIREIPEQLQISQ